MPNMGVGYMAKRLARESRESEEEREARRLQQKRRQADRGDAAGCNSVAWYLVTHGGDLDEALELSRKAVALKPTNGSYIDTLGWVLWKLGRKEEAIPLLIEGHEREPSDPIQTYHAAIAYAALGKHGRAEELLSMALPIAPDDKLAAAVRRELETSVSADRGGNGSDTQE
jgi:tetratricopeptide (TPR) repeat protein